MPKQRFSLSRRLQKTIYIRFSHELLSVACIEKQSQREELPVIARSAHSNTIAYGAQAQFAVADQRAPSTLIAPFAHPRICISDYEAAEQLVAAVIHTLVPRFWLKPAMVIHPLDTYEGGLTPVEIHVMLDLLLNLGAQQAYVWIGRTLLDEELRRLDFPENEGQVFSRNDPSRPS